MHRNAWSPSPECALRARVERGEALVVAIGRVTERLDRRGLNAFNRSLEGERTAAIDSTVSASLDLLAEFDHGGQPAGFHAQRYYELAVFPEDAEIPISTIARLWGRIGDVDDLATEELLELLFGLALLQALDLKKRTVRLHDVMRTYLGERAKDVISALHKHVVSAYDDKSGSDIEDAEERRYFFERYPSHLAGAGELEVLDSLLLDPQWMQRKLDALGSPLPLIADYENLALGQLQSLIGRTLRLTSGIISRDRRQLIPQLHGRLLSIESVEAQNFLSDARHLLTSPAILTKRPSLTPPGAELGRFECSEDGVYALLASADGHLIVGNHSGNIEVWDPCEGALVGQAHNHEGAVQALISLPNSRFASASRDATIRIWKLNSNSNTALQEESSSQKFGAEIISLAALADGTFLSGSLEPRVRLWNHLTRSPDTDLQDHFGIAICILALPSGDFALGQLGGTIELWHSRNMSVRVHLTGHTDTISSLVNLTGGRLASGSDDSTIRIWDVATGINTQTLQGDFWRVTALQEMPNGRLASAYSDNSIWIWQLSTGKPTLKLEGHTDDVNCLVVLPDGSLASGSSDGTVRLWDVSIAEGGKRLSSHGGSVEVLAPIASNQVVSGSSDHSICLWNSDTGSELKRISGHDGRILALSGLPGNRLLSSATDASIRMWDLNSGSELLRCDARVDETKQRPLFKKSILETSIDFANSAAAIVNLQDGRFVSYSDDWLSFWTLTKDGRFEVNQHHKRNKIHSLTLVANQRLVTCERGAKKNKCNLYIWEQGDVKSNEPALIGEVDWANIVAAIPNSRLALSGYENIIRIVNLSSCVEIQRLIGHNGYVTAFAAMPNGFLATGSEDATVRIWNIEQAIEITRLECDAPIKCLVALTTGVLVAGDALGRMHWLEIVE